MFERCDRCFGMIMYGKCACGKHTTVETAPFPVTIVPDDPKDEKIAEQLSSLVNLNPLIREEVPNALKKYFDDELAQYLPETNPCQENVDKDSNPFKKAIQDLDEFQKEYEINNPERFKPIRFKRTIKEDDEWLGSI